MGKVLKNLAHIITSPYGNRNGSFHGGVDITGYKKGTHLLDYICAKDAGKVVAVRKNCTGFENGGSYGNYVIIDHGSGYKTVYAHMAHGSVVPNVGDKVAEGQVIGYMGNTGTSYGGHLHFEVRHNDQKINPTEYLDKELPLAPSAPAKTVDEVAKDVIAGKYGNYPERKALLEAEGYNYAEVQKRVDAMLAPKPAPAPAPIKVGESVIVTGVGTASSNGTGFRTRHFNGQRMKVIAINAGSSHPYALNQYNAGNAGDYSQVTAWFSASSIRRG